MVNWKVADITFVLCAIVSVLVPKAGCLKYEIEASSADMMATSEFCSTEECRESRLEIIRKQYSGLFFTEEEITERLRHRHRGDREKFVFNETDSADTLVGDGDSCCATDLAYTRNDTLLDMLGNARTIVHYPPKYQYVPRITCISRGCTGTCVIESTYLNLLVYDEEGTNEDDVTFEWFPLPGYCSCKNIS